MASAAALPPLIAQAEFAATDVQRVVALVTAFSQATFAFAPVAFGALRDLGQTMGMSTHAGSASLLFCTAALIQFTAAGEMMFGRRPIVTRRASVL